MQTQAAASTALTRGRTIGRTTACRDANMPTLWVQQLFRRLSNWIPHRGWRLRRATRLTASGKVRIAVPPPALQPWSHSDAGLDSDWQVSHWLDSSHARAVAVAGMAGSSSHQPLTRAVDREITPLQDIRLEFLAALRDLPSPASRGLEARIRASRSLRELWHLRPEVFKLVALHRDQHAAQARLDRLNRHFPSDVLGKKPHQPSLHPLRTAP